jgi:hypothetical protein
MTPADVEDGEPLLFERDFFARVGSGDGAAWASDGAGAEASAAFGSGAGAGAGEERGGTLDGRAAGAAAGAVGSALGQVCGLLGLRHVARAVLTACTCHLRGFDKSATFTHCTVSLTCMPASST